MKLNKIALLLLVLATSLTLGACAADSKVENVKDYVNNKTESNDQFDFPGNYIAPELRIDGLMDDEQWKNCSEKLTFGAQNEASMVIYRGTDALFCFFEVKDADIQTVGNNNGDDVTKGDSVEVYFDFKNDGAKEPTTDDIQINIGAHGKTRIFVGVGGEWGAWNGLLDYQVELQGTLNNEKDVDTGYTVELMIPYSQIGIDQGSVFGVSVGHVARGLDSTHDTLKYTWGGMVYEGNFVDPQSPQAYLIYSGDKFYLRGNEPIGPIKLNGKVVDANGTPLDGVKVMVAGKEAMTNSNGIYTLPDLDYLSVSEVVVSKDGYQTYTYNVASSILRNESGEVDLNFCLLKENEDKTVTLTGVVKNPVADVMANVNVTTGETTTTTNEKGEFSLDVKLSYDLGLTVTKLGYKDSVTKLNIVDLVGKTSHNIGIVNLYSPSANTTFGGERGLPLVETEIYRGYQGVHFLFKTDSKITNGSKIELFIDAKDSFAGRDYNDYRIDLDGDGGIKIENYGGGSNNVVSKSGIKNETYLFGESYYMDVLIPYEFLEINQLDVIGISFGILWVVDGFTDWSGWGYAGAGFDDYVAPEFTDQYCRLGLDNVLYRASGNDVKVNRVTGKVADGNQNPVTTATVNGIKVNNDGSFNILITGDSLDVVVNANGYISTEFKVNASDFEDGIAYKEVVLVQAVATITGTCNVEGAKVYLESDPSIFTYVSNSTYTIVVPTTGNAKLVFESQGYAKQIVSVGKAALVQSANTQTAITKNVVMVIN